MDLSNSDQIMSMKPVIDPFECIEICMVRVVVVLYKGVLAMNPYEVVLGASRGTLDGQACVVGVAMNPFEDYWMACMDSKKHPLEIPL
eukprot:1148663-Pelagomonas_calceolata.AAC.11